ncbi:MAG: ribonuclease P protein component [Bacteroidia bacterium]|nr:ribonuclease P protein component [Bacteroidia bacterium]
MGTLRFHKSERLCNKNLINKVFSKGNCVIYQFPLCINWVEVPLDSFEAQAQVVISVSKRSFPKAASRNRIKRQIREAYRLNKYLLLTSLKNENKKIVFSISYQSKANSKYEQIQNSLIKLFKKINGDIQKNI